MMVEDLILPQGVKARRVYLTLREQITTGKFSEGDLIPGEQRLAQLHGVSRVTVRRALDALYKCGLIEKKVGKGTLVRRGARPVQPVAMSYSSIMPQRVEMGQNTSARLLSFFYAAAPKDIAAALSLGDSDEVQVATRVRMADGTPFSHLTTYVPAAVARTYSEDELALMPLYTLLERSGVRVKAAHQTVSATLASPQVAQALDIAEGSALLSLRRVVFDEHDGGVEYLSALYRPDMFRLEMPLTRVGDGQERHWEPSIGPAEREAS